MNVPDIIKLNIGGIRYSTTWTTLHSFGDNFLTIMISNDIEGKIKSLKDDKGCYFVDRNGRLFEYVLDLLRHGVLQVPSGVSKEILQREIDFYQISYDNNSTSTKATYRDELRTLSHNPAFPKAMEFLEMNWEAIFKILKSSASNGETTASLSVRKEEDRYWSPEFFDLELTKLLHAQFTNISHILRLHYGFTVITKEWKESRGNYLKMWIGWEENSQIKAALINKLSDAVYDGVLHVKDT